MPRSSPQEEWEKGGGKKYGVTRALFRRVLVDVTIEDECCGRVSRARQRREIAVVERVVEGARFDDFGLSLEEGKVIQRRLQEELTQFQVDQASQHDRKCHDCGRLQGVHDYRSSHGPFALWYLSCDDHRQTRILRRGQTQHHARRRTPFAQGIE